MIGPKGGKLNGAWIVANRNAAEVAPTGYKHQYMWKYWDWEGWMRPNIDYIMGDLGCNVVATPADIWGIPMGAYSSAEYIARQVQVAEYVKSKGGYYYANGTSLAPPYATDYLGMPAETFAGYLAPVLKSLDAVGNVIGCNVIDEGHIMDMFSTVWYRAMMAGLKGAGVQMPLTCSVALDAGAGANPATWLANRIDSMDFLAIHFFVYPILQTALDTYLTTTTKDILIGSCGMDLNTTGSPFVSNLEGVYKLAYSGNPRIKGILQWSIGDFGASGENADNWGLFDTNATPGKFLARRYKVDQIRKYTRGSVALSTTI